MYHHATVYVIAEDFSPDTQHQLQADLESRFHQIPHCKYRPHCLHGACHTGDSNEPQVCVSVPNRNIADPCKETFTCDWFENETFVDKHALYWFFRIHC